MKRRKPLPPLLDLVEPPRYVIDSSSWFDISERPDRDEVWAVIIDVISGERVLLPTECVDEIRLDEELWARLSQLETKFRASGNEEVYLLAGRIAAAFPGMARIRSKKTKADPFVVALASVERALLVCHETTRKAPNRKIPTACDRFGVRCITIDDLLEIEQNGKA